MKTKHLVIIAAILITVIVGAVLAVEYYQSLQIGGNGIIRTVGLAAWNDAGKTSPCTNINWGTMNRGGTATHTVYIENGGNVNATLHMVSGNFTPSGAGSYIMVTWDSENKIIQPATTIPCIFTLNIQLSTPTNITSFTYDMTVSGT